MFKTIFIILALVVACAASAAAADNFDGSITLGGDVSNIKGQKAKAAEYRSPESGALGGLDLNYRDPQMFFELNGDFQIIDGKDKGSDSLATDNNVLLRGGISDLFKGSVFYNEINHNITFGAKTYFNGVGTNFLSAPITAPTATTVFGKEFDYAIKRQNYGGTAEFNFKSPFFLTVRADQTETKGLQPYGFYTSLREVPAIIDYTTDNLTLQTGYRSRHLIFTIDGALSKFDNAHHTMQIQQGATLATTIPNTLYLPPDNRFYSIGGSFTYRAPYWNTTFMARGSHSDSTSVAGISEQTTIGSSGVLPANYFTRLRWEGDVIYNSASISITSKPTMQFDTRLFYNFFERDNNSDSPNALSYNNVTIPHGGPAATIAPGKLGYDKHNAGVDLGYKLPADTKLSAGYDFTQTSRSSFWSDPRRITDGNPEITLTTDHTVYVQVSNNLLDTVSGKLRYEHLFRNANASGLNQYLPTERALYFRGYEDFNKNMDAVKAELEFELLHALTLGVEYAYKINDYPNSPLGMQDDTRHEVYTDLTYTHGPVRLNVFGEVEMVETNSTFYAGTINAAPSAANFFYTTKREDFNYAFGGKVDVELVRNRLNLSAGYRYDNAKGTNDFTTSFTPAIVPINVTALDDCLKHTVNAKLTYKATPHWSFDLGYLYEHLKYTDDAYRGYSNFVVGQSYALTGAYNNPNYDASAFYMSTTFTF